MSQRKADEETARILAEKAAAATEDGQDGENTEEITITSDTSTTVSNGGEIPDVSPSALPTTESQLQPAATVASIGGSATGAGGAGDGTTVVSITQQKQHEDLMRLRTYLPSFVAACMNIQSRVTAVSTTAENGNDLPQQGSYVQN